MPRRVSPSVTIDLGLLVLLSVLVLAVVAGSASLRPYDSPGVDPNPWLLPVYLLRSLARMAVAYAVAVSLALAVGHLAARSRLARKVILPTLDVLQSVPILGFFPAAVTVFIGVFGPSALGVEAAAVFLIFTSMFWNMAFGVYGSLITIPEELSLAARQFHLRGSLRWSRLLLPVVVPSLLYNSILSWANGWYFLIASEIIAAGPARYTLPGIGAYLSQAIAFGRGEETALALLTLLVTTVGLHVLLWAPLETWAERFRLEEMGEHPRVPRLARVLARSRLVRGVNRAFVLPVAQAALRWGGGALAFAERYGKPLAIGSGLAAAAVVALAVVRLEQIVFGRPLSAEARAIPASLLLSFARVVAGIVLAFAAALPLAYLASTWGQRGRSALLSVLQIVGSFPATAFFPLVAAGMLAFGLDMNVGSVLLVVTGTFLYVCFNALAGVASMPAELSEAASALGLRGMRYVRRMFLPAILPGLVTGGVTAWGGAWNAIILSEYVMAEGRLYAVRGIGATLDRATYVTGDGQVVLLSLAAMVGLVLLVNRIVWEPLYERVAQRYKMDA